MGTKDLTHEAVAQALDSLRKAHAHIAVISGSALLAGELCPESDKTLLYQEACRALACVASAIYDLEPNAQQAPGLVTLYDVLSEDSGPSEPKERLRKLLQTPSAPEQGVAGTISQASRDVLAERERQVTQEGWTPEHDDQHGDHSMAIAAACYALVGTPVGTDRAVVHASVLWRWTGWSPEWFKPKAERQNLVRAAALLLAQIERLDRAAARKDAQLVSADAVAIAHRLGAEDGGAGFLNIPNEGALSVAWLQRFAAAVAGGKD